MGPLDTPPVPRRGREEDPRRDAPRSSRDVLSAENREAPTLPQMVLFFPKKREKGETEKPPAPLRDQRPGPRRRGRRCGGGCSGTCIITQMLLLEPFAYLLPPSFSSLFWGVFHFFLKKIMFILIFLLNTPEKAARCCPLRPVYL